MGRKKNKKRARKLMRQVRRFAVEALAEFAGKFLYHRLESDFSGRGEASDPKQRKLPVEDTPASSQRELKDAPHASQ